MIVIIVIIIIIILIVVIVIMVVSCAQSSFNQARNLGQEFRTTSVLYICVTATSKTQLRLD